MSRIASYRGLRHELEAQIADLKEELDAVERRLKMAEELYEAEFRELPQEVDANSAAGQLGVDRKPSGPLTDLSWADAIVRILHDEGRPLHVKEIWRLLKAGGFHTDARDPMRSIVSIAIRNRAFIRIGPNEYALNGLKSAGEASERGC
jgi:hypothetical protein